MKQVLARAFSSAAACLSSAETWRSLMERAWRIGDGGWEVAGVEVEEGLFEPEDDEALMALGDGRASIYS